MKFLALAIAALASTTQAYDLSKFTEGVEAEVDLGPTTGLDVGGRVGIGRLASNPTRLRVSSMSQHALVCPGCVSTPSMP